MKFLLKLLFCYISLSVSSQNQLRKELEKIVAYDSDISYDLTPGFIIGIVDGDSIFFESFGHHAGTKELIDPIDIFEIGSISKTITASLILQLQSKKVLNIKDKVNKFFPIEFHNPRLKNLTIQDLLNHNTGFSKRPSKIGTIESEMQNPYSSYQKEDLLSYYKNYVPEGKNGFNYSHTAYALLEVIVENSMNKKFHDILQQEIFEALNMSNSFVNYSEKKINVISPGQDRSLSSVQPWDFNSFSASEGIKTSALDLTYFIKNTIGQSKTKNLSWKLISELSIPTYNEKLFYSYGWHNMQINKKTKAYISTGNTSGHSGFIGLIPETNTGVVILSNSPYGTKDLGLLVLRMINYNWKRKA